MTSDTATEDLPLIECYVKIIEDQHITKDDVIQIVGGFIEITLNTSIQSL